MSFYQKSLIGFCALCLLAGCRSTYYDTMETFGFEKRDILVDRVEEARDAQQETKEEFASALEAFSAVTEFDGGKLEKVYDRLRGKLDDVQGSARNIRERIDAVERVAGDLFSEWRDELDQYENRRLREQSEAQLERTEERYAELIDRMRSAEERIDPVLSLFQDQVLFLKHNLNANAIASLENETERIRADVSELIEEIEASINEANSFIESMQ